MENGVAGNDNANADAPPVRYKHEEAGQVRTRDAVTFAHSELQSPPNRHE